MEIPAKKKRHLTYVTIGIFFLLQGIEYAVILPTLWLYLEHSFHSQPYMLGFILSSFSLAGLIASPIAGRWSDRTRNTKSILLFSNVLQFIGSVMYFMGISVWFLVGARFVAGLGSGVGSAMFADIARVTSPEERTAVMSMFMAVRQVGLLLGPGCNIFLRHLNFHIWKFAVNKYTAPGIFMAVLWVLHEVLVVFMYWNLPRLKLEETIYKQQQESLAQSSQSRILAASRIPNMESPSLVQPATNSSRLDATLSSPRAASRKHHRRSRVRGRAREAIISDPDDDPAYLTSSNEIIEGAERMMGSRDGSYSEGNSQQRYGAIPPSYDDGRYDSSLSSSFPPADLLQRELESPDGSIQGTPEPHTVKLTPAFLYNEFVREEIIVILFTCFVAFFNQVGMETLFTPLSQRLLGWEELENSILFCAAGAEVIAVFFLVRFLSRRMSDRWLLLIGFSILTLTIAVSTWFLPQAKPGEVYNLPCLLAIVLVDVFSLPFLAVTSASLYSKITREETQGFAQGVRRGFAGLGTILGPLWAACLLHHLLVTFAVMLVICVLSMLMLLVSFKHLKEPDVPGHKVSKRSPECGAVTVSWDDTEDEQTERAALLRGHHNI